MRASELSGTIGITLDADEPAYRSARRITGEPAPTQVVRFVYGRLLPGDDLVRTYPRAELCGIRRWRAFRCLVRNRCLTSDSPQPHSGSRDSASEGIEHPQAGVHCPLDDESTRGPIDACRFRQRAHNQTSDAQCICCHYVMRGALPRRSSWSHYSPYHPLALSSRSERREIPRNQKCP